MSSQNDEVEFQVRTSEDGKTITIEITAQHELSYQDLLENLIFCYHELKRAYDQKEKLDVNEH